MKAVAAREELRRLPRRVKRLEADRAVRQGRISRTRMRLQGRGLDARSALVAVRVRLLAADAANPALFAVILPLVHVVEQDALCAPIGPERDAAAETRWTGVLLRVATHTLDSLHRLPVQLVSLLGVGVRIVFYGIVAEAARKELAAARGQQSRLALVVLAAFVRSRHCALRRKG